MTLKICFSSQTLAVVTVAFVPAAYTVREDQGPVSVCLRIIDGSLAPGVTATVSIDSADGTATREFVWSSSSHLIEGLRSRVG